MEVAKFFAIFTDLVAPIEPLPEHMTALDKFLARVMKDIYSQEDGEYSWFLACDSHDDQLVSSQCVYIISRRYIRQREMFSFHLRPDLKYHFFFLHYPGFTHPILLRTDLQLFAGVLRSHLHTSIIGDLFPQALFIDRNTGNLTKMSLYSLEEMVGINVAEFRTLRVPTLRTQRHHCCKNENFRTQCEEVLKTLENKDETV